MQAEIISVGTELILGDIIDTNSAYLAREMAKLGIDVYFKSTVGDNKLRLLETIRIATSRANLIIFTGGLGPTEDDLTKETLASFLNIPLYQDPEEVLKLENFFAARGRKMSANNLRQAQIPRGAYLLENDLGTASGLILKNNDKYYILLPGPPAEMKNMFTKKVLSWFKENFNLTKQHILSHTLKFIGISESQLETELYDLLHEQTNPTVALLAKNGEIHCRLTAKVENREEFKKLTNPIIEKILGRVGEYYFGANDEKLEEIIGQQLLKNNLTLVTAESCTGGLIAKRITDIAGSSKYFLGSVVAYENKVKNKILQVPEEVLIRYGAVSEETAKAMAKGVRKSLNADLALAITGIAGPAGGSELKPVGLVYISLIGENINICKRYVFSGNRADIRWRSSTWALNLLQRSLSNIEEKST